MSEQCRDVTLIDVDAELVYGRLLFLIEFLKHKRAIVDNMKPLQLSQDTDVASEVRKIDLVRF